MMVNSFPERHPRGSVTQAEVKQANTFTPLQSSLLAQADSLRAQADTLEALAKSMIAPAPVPMAVSANNVKPINVKQIHAEYDLPVELIQALFRDGSLPNLGSRTQFKTSRLAVEEYLARRSTGRA